MTVGIYKFVIVEVTLIFTRFDLFCIFIMRKFGDRLIRVFHFFIVEVNLISTLFSLVMFSIFITRKFAKRCIRFYCVYSESILVSALFSFLLFVFS